jgi:hypothetical protein
MTSSERSRLYRERMKAKGFRRVQLWVWDTRTPEFQERARRACEAIRNSPGEAEIMDEIEALSTDLLKNDPY